MIVWPLVSWPLWLLFSDITTFPDLSNWELCYYYWWKLLPKLQNKTQIVKKIIPEAADLTNGLNVASLVYQLCFLYLTEREAEGVDIHPGWSPWSEARAVQQRPLGGIHRSRHWGTEWQTDRTGYGLSHGALPILQLHSRLHWLQRWRLRPCQLLRPWSPHWPGCVTFPSSDPKPNPQ